MKKLVFYALMALNVSCAMTTRNYTDYVNTFLGTETLWDSLELGFVPSRRTWGAEVFPGSSLPFAMVQVSPVTTFRSGAGYQYEDKQICGFSHTNKGHWNLNHIPILPFTGEISIDDYASPYSHDKESARPAYYQVYLERFGVNVELTSTLRSAFHRYTFDKNEDYNVLVNLLRSNEGVRDWAIEQNSANSFSGYQNTGQTIYFYAESNLPIEAVDSLTKLGEGYIYDSSDAAGSNGLNRNANYLKPIPVVKFRETSKSLELKIGFSFVSVEGAKNNLESEIADKSFEQVKADGDRVWNDMLSKIDVEGGSYEQQRTFYSTLYRSMLWPALRSDVDGSFKSPKGGVKNTGFNYYTDPSFWDDYRNKLVLLGMVAPDVANDVISSCIEMGEANNDFMINFFHGDHASVFISGSYLRGLRDYDVQKAYRMMLKNATVEGPSRPYLQEYIDNGYISEVELKGSIEIHTDAKASVTKTQEYSYNDYAVALLAKELGDMESHDVLMKRIHNYRNLYNPATRFMQGKLADGRWIDNFDPCFPYYHYQFREATAWMSAFFAPHDTQGMIEMYGGTEKFEQKLDSLFTTPWKGYEAHNLSGFIGQYCHGNQPDHTFPFLYYFINKGAKSQAIIDNLLNNYYNMGENGLAYSGMDDAGEMSSWYVLSAIGLYTYSPADPKYIITVPLFDKVTFALGENPFTIVKSNPGRELVEAQYEGKTIEGLFIDHSDLLRGKELTIMTK